MPVVVSQPTADFVTSTLSGAMTAGTTSATIGAGLNIPATNGILQIDYDSVIAVGVDNGPETVFYTTYTSGSGALAGLTRGVAGTTGVAHANGAKVQQAASAYWFGNAIIKAPDLSTSAIKLGQSFTQVANQAGVGADTMVNLVSGTSITLTIPAGGRDVLIMGNVQTLKNGASGGTTLTLRNGSTTAGAVIGINNTNVTTGRFNIVATAYLVAPAAGTYIVGMSLASSGSTSDIDNTDIGQGSLIALCI